MFDRLRGWWRRNADVETRAAVEFAAWGFGMALAVAVSVLVLVLVVVGASFVASAITSAFTP